ncbi:Uncharacterized protein TCM_033398 [Theobroma cacao]|uniref:Uncharacterized protein n=1 Tax=Theobroma cacao TaxID=3641 RepID=A0A061FB49_THECC|nr:Uncharacterized protein TCM_033398 [Theobroma cacao]
MASFLQGLWLLKLRKFEAITGIPSKCESSACVDYVPSLCKHYLSLLPIEWSGEVFKLRWCRQFAAQDVAKSPLNLII